MKRILSQDRFEAFLERFSKLHVLVIGDFFLDKYLIIERQLSETSLETNLEAHQIVEIRCSPGAAGTVTSNLHSLGVNVSALGCISSDGQGYELKRELDTRGVNTEHLIERTDGFTPIYIKPIIREKDGVEHEIERFDIKNRTPLTKEVQNQIIEHLRNVIHQVHGVIIADQVQEANCGVITDLTREAIGELALKYPQVVFAADSRIRIGLLRHVIIKPNALEATLAVFPDGSKEFNLSTVQKSGSELYKQNQKPVFVTLGADGILVFTASGCKHVHGISVQRPVDIVGAGDSTMSGIVSALCSGANPEEAAFIGNLVASITIQQIGTTGTASPNQLKEQFIRIQ